MAEYFTTPLQSSEHVAYFASQDTDAIDILMEECAELIQACSKVLRSRRERIKGSHVADPSKCYDNLVEEMADVYIVMNTVRMQTGIMGTELQDKVNAKLVRYGLQPDEVEISVSSNPEITYIKPKPKRVAIRRRPKDEC